MRRLATVCVSLLLFTTPSAQAASCSVSALSLIFPPFDTLILSDGVTTLTVGCRRSGGQPETVNYTVALSTGSGTYAARLMFSGTNQLTYNLYTTAARNQVWGDGSAGTQLVGGTISVPGPPGNPTITASHSVYGRISAPQNVAAGAYITSSPIVVTVVY